MKPVVDTALILVLTAVADSENAARPQILAIL